MDSYIPGRAHEEMGTALIVYPQEFGPEDLVVNADFDSDHSDVVMKTYRFDPPKRSVSEWHQKKWDALCELRKEPLNQHQGQKKLDLIVERIRAGDYTLYTRLIRPTFTFAPLHAKFSELMEALLFKMVLHGMLSCGPRLGKSTLMCLLVTYIYGLSGGRANNLYTTYGGDLTHDFGNEILNTVLQPTFRNLFPTARLRQDSQAKKRFEFENGGKFFASSVGGALTGKGAGTMDPNEFGGISVVDDPVKEMSEAISATKMARLHSWYDNEFNTRSNSNAVQLITGTRYGVNDLHAHLLKTDETGNEPGLYDSINNPNGKWVYLNIQTLCLDDRDDPLGRKIGESAWEEKIPAKLLYEKMEDPDQFATFWALYQGHPQSKRGGMFKPWYLHVYENPSELRVDFIFMSIDPAFGIGRDETAITIFGVTPDREKCIVITQESSAKWEFPELKTKVKQYARQWNVKKVVVEDSATGKPLYQTFLQEYSEISIELVSVGGKNKQERLSMALPLFKEDTSIKEKSVPPRIWFLSGLYLVRLRYQLENFPFAPKDDLVDSLVIGAIYFRDFLYMVFDYTGSEWYDPSVNYQSNKILEVEQLKNTSYVKALLEFGIVDDDDSSMFDEVMAEMGISALSYGDDDNSLLDIRYEASFGESLYN